MRDDVGGTMLIVGIDVPFGATDHLVMCEDVLDRLERDLGRPPLAIEVLRRKRELGPVFAENVDRLGVYSQRVRDFFLAATPPHDADGTARPWH